LIPTIRFFWDVKIFIEKEAYINKFLLENLEKRLDNLEKRFDTAEKNNAKEIHELKQNIKEIENEKGY
jgi:chaperonin cofactor prefoldin